MRKKLVLSDREEISRGLAEGLQYKEIGLRMGGNTSVISREVARHGTVNLVACLVAGRIARLLAVR